MVTIPLSDHPAAIVRTRGLLPAKERNLPHVITHKSGAATLSPEFPVIRSEVIRIHDLPARRRGVKTHVKAVRICVVQLSTQPVVACAA